MCDQPMCAQLDENGPGVMVTAQRLIAFRRKVRFDAHRLIALPDQAWLECAVEAHGVSAISRARCTPLLIFSFGQERIDGCGNPGQRSSRSDSFASISEPLASPERMPAGASCCWPKGSPLGMSDDQTASAGSEPACRPGSTPGRGTGETDGGCCRTRPGGVEAVVIGTRPELPEGTMCECA